jgi:predicted kinase
MKKWELALFNKIYSRHKLLLRNLSEKNPKRLIIGIAGVPGSGKTLLARHIARRFKAMRISNDEIRRIIRSIVASRRSGGPSDVQNTLQDYLLFLFGKISKSSPNKLAVLDSGIERKYDRVRRWCLRNKYDFFVIKISIDKKQLLKHLRERKKAAKRYIPYLHKWFSDYNTFSKRRAERAIFKNDGKIRTLRSFVNELELD